jgi:hypothetical protein
MNQTESRFEEKTAQRKESKVNKSARIRRQRIQLASNATLAHPSNKKICGECGFRVRGENHSTGNQHLGVATPCHRGR